ncbi:MAG: pitrilysin family protein [Thermoguttaceae bacterium]
MTDITSHTYGNGLVLLAEPMPWLQSAALSFLVPAGCVREPPGRSGLGALTCEMTVRGAGPRDSRQLVLDLDNLGVEHNESVSAAHAVYCGATLAENLPEALAVFADILRRPRLPAEQLEAGRQVVLQELRAIEDEPADKVMLDLRRRHYPSPWGRSSFGEQEAVQSVTIGEIRGFFRRHFQPNGTILGVAGHVEWEPLVDLVGRLLGDWEPQPVEPLVEEEGPQGYGHIPYDSGQTQIGIAYASVPYRDPDYFQAWGAVGALSGGMSSRLFTEVREKRGLCYAVSASYHTLRDRGAVLCYAASGAQRAQETLDVTLGELVRLGRGIESHELDRLKARIKNALILQQESSSARSGAIARDWYHLGRARTLEEIGRLVDGLTSRSINAYLAGHPPRDFTVVTLGEEPLKVNVPAPSVV